MYNLANQRTKKDEKMTTTYSNTNNSKLVIWTSIFIGVIGIGVLVLRFLFKDTVNLVVFIADRCSEFL